jgi:hypothetical protein
MYPHFPLQDPPKFTQNGIFGLKINHLATLSSRPKRLSGIIILERGQNCDRIFTDFWRKF